MFFFGIVDGNGCCFVYLLFPEWTVAKMETSGSGGWKSKKVIILEHIILAIYKSVWNLLLVTNVSENYVCSYFSYITEVLRIRLEFICGSFQKICLQILCSHSIFLSPFN